jgi:hypothetical protein
MLDTTLGHLRQFATEFTASPFHRLDQICSLEPSQLTPALVFLAAAFLINDLLRTAMMPESPRSVLAHLVICLLTLWPGIVLGFVLLWAGHRHPDRVWINLGLAALLYVPWILGGKLTRLSRSDSEGADIGWIAHGALITFPAGLIAALVF